MWFLAFAAPLSWTAAAASWIASGDETPAIHRHLQNGFERKRERGKTNLVDGSTNTATVATDESISKKRQRKHAPKNDGSAYGSNARAAARARRKKLATASPRNTGPTTTYTVGTFLVAQLEQYWFFDEPELTNNVEFNDGLIYTLTNVSQDWLDGDGSTLDSGVDLIRIPSGVNVTGAQIDFNGSEPEVIPREESPTTRPTEKV